MAIEAPSLPVTERITVPASAIFSEAELAPPPPPVAKEPNSPLPEPPAPKASAPTPAPEGATGATGVTGPAAAPAPTPAPEGATGATGVTGPALEAPAKVKIGDKEYTKAELEAALAARSAPQPAPAAAPAPAPAPAKVPTPEEIATAESAWQEKFVTDEKLSVPVPFTEKEMETILAGDKDGVALLSSKISTAVTQSVAKAVMLARKSIYQELNPIIGRLEGNLQPVLANAQQVEAAAAEHQFFTAYPDFKNHADTVRRVGEAILTRYPKEVAAMTREQLLAEVAAQSDRIIQSECDRFAPGKNWRTLQQAAAPAPAPAPIPAPAPAPIPAPVAAPSAVKPPSGNSPAATGTSGATPNWHKATASSLAN